MAGAFGTRLAPIPSDYDPNALPMDLGFGPVTPDSIAGRVPPKSLMERLRALGSQALAVGEAPARATVDQYLTAGKQVAGAVRDPSLPNLTGAAFNTALAVGRPAAAALSLAGGAGLIGAKEYLPGLFGTPATAADAMPGVDPKMMDQYTKNQKLIKRVRDPDDPRVQEAMRFNSNVEGISADFLKAQNAARVKNSNAAAEASNQKMMNDEQLRAKKEEQKQAEYAGAVRKAETMRDADLARVKRFSSWGSPWKKLYDNIGGEAAAPFSTGMAEGALARMAMGGGKSIPGKIIKDWVIPSVVGGASGFATSNVPDAYNYQANDPDNPFKAAYSDYARELPPGHPRKQEMTEYAKGLPATNPVRDAAMEDYYGHMGERAGIGGLEGAAGGKFGNLAIGAVARGARGLWDGAFGRSNPASAETQAVAPSALNGAFEAGEPALRDVTPPIAAPRPSVAPRGVQGPSAYDLMTMKPRAAVNKVDAAIAKADAADAKAKAQALVDEVKQVHPNMRKADIKKLISANPDLTDLPSVTRHLTKLQLETKTAPGAYTKALEDQFGKSDNGAELLTRGK